MMEEDPAHNTTAAMTSWNASVDQLLEARMGPRSKDMVSAVLLTIVYSLIFLSGSLGNICTCIVIVRNHCMQTTTNYYLFSLALSDLLLLFFGLPPELFSIWMAYPWLFGEAFCYIRQTVLELTSYASVLTITAFTVERYIAVCRPLLSHKIAVLSRAVKIIVCIWIVSLLVALPYAVHTRLHYLITWPPTGQPVVDSLVCSIPEKWLEKRMTYMFQISTFLFFLAPVTLIICLYILIGIAVRRSPLSRGSSDDQSQYRSQKHISLPHQPRRVVIRMLVAVTVAFIICWAPFHTQRLMVLYIHNWTPELLAAQSHIFYISGVLYFVSSTVNPILYNVISRRYRVAFKQTIFGACLGKTGAGQQRPGSHNTHNRYGRGKGEQLFQQRHSLLDKGTQPRSSQRLKGSLRDSAVSEKRSSQDDVKNSSQKDDNSGPKASLKNDVMAPGASCDDAKETSDPPRTKDLARSLCPDILNCQRVLNDAVRNSVEESSEDTSNCNHRYCKFGAPQTGKLNHVGSPAPADVLQNGPDVSEVTTPSPNVTPKLDNTHQDENLLAATTRHTEKYLSSCKSKADSKTHSSLIGKKPGLRNSAEESTEGPRSKCSAPYSSSHRHGVAGKLPDISASLCKKCLPNAPAPNTRAPYSDVEAYHVSYDVSQPHTIV